MMATADPSSGGAGPPRETSRQRAARIPLDYWKQRGPIDRWKLILSGVAALAAVALWLGARFLLPGGDSAFASPGPLAGSHHRYNNDCAQCHVDFQPIKADNALSGWLGVGAGCSGCHN